MSAAYKIYSIDQVCKLSDGYSVVTFKSEEAKLPVGISVFDAKSNLLVHNKLACKSLGGEGARLYVENLKDNKIEANCTSGHMGENVTQVYSFDYESLTPTLLREQ